MPNFAAAQINQTSFDLSAYKTFLRKLAVGQLVNLPLEPGEHSRRVMRALNAAAAEEGMRLSRLASAEHSVRFRVQSPEKRRVNLSAEGRRARAEKAKATRAAKRRAS